MGAVVAASRCGQLNANPLALLVLDRSNVLDHAFHAVVYHHLTRLELIIGRLIRAFFFVDFIRQRHLGVSQRRYRWGLDRVFVVD